MARVAGPAVATSATGQQLAVGPQGPAGAGINLQGVPISTTSPTNGQVLGFNGSLWLPVNPGVYGTDKNAVLSYIEPQVTTANATPVNTATAVYPMPDLTMADVIVRVEAKQQASANCFRQDYRAVYTRNGTAPTINGSVVAGTAGGSGLAASATIAVVGNTVLVTLTGVAATTIVWSVTMTVNPVTTAS